MAAPDTMGKLCTRLSDMNVGDYIKCVYEAPIKGKPGFFSQLGIENPKKEITETIDGGTATTKEEEYAELDATAPSATPSGYFYFIKSGAGELVADRMLQSDISWDSLNNKNVVLGGIRDIINNQTTVTITTTKAVAVTQSGDAASDTTSVVKDDLDNNKLTQSRVVVTLDENLNQTTTATSSVVTEYAKHLSTYADSTDKEKVLVNVLPADKFTSIIKEGTLDGNVTAGGLMLTTKVKYLEFFADTQKELIKTYFDWNAVSATTPTTVALSADAYSDTSYKLAYRPLVKYIDNTDSTNLFY